jgi:hypothetical protein
LNVDDVVFLPNEKVREIVLIKLITLMSFLCSYLYFFVWISGFFVEKVLLIKLNNIEILIDFKYVYSKIIYIKELK